MLNILKKINQYINLKYLILAIVVFILQFIILTFAQIGNTPPYDTQLIAVLTMTLIIFIVIATKWGLNDLHLNNRPFNTKVLIYSIEFIVLYIGVTYGLRYIFPDTTSTNQTSLENAFGTQPLLLILALTIASPICEELIFRLLLPKAIGGSVLGYTIATVLFITTHTPNTLYALITYTGMTLIFLYSYVKSKNIYNSIIVHILWNILAVITIFI